MIGTGNLSAGESLRCEANPPYRILVAEDDPAILRLSVRTLTGYGYNVDSAVDGGAAWAALEIRHYDLLVTDHDMPRMTGVEVLAKLFAAQMTVPAVLISGTVPWEEFTRNPWLKPAATLLKPYLLSEMLRTVRDVLGHSENQRAIASSRDCLRQQPLE